MRHPVNRPIEGQISATDSGMKWLETVSRNSIDIRSVDVSINPNNIAANTTAVQNVTITGLKAGDLILKVIKPTHTAGLLVGESLVSAADTLTVQFVNVSTGAINAGAETYTVIYIKNTTL